MAVLSTTNTVHYACNNSTVDFDFSFKIFASSDLEVIMLNTVTEASETLELTTDYTVSAPNNDFSGGGTVTTLATWDSDYEIWIVRKVPYTQPTELEEGGKIPSTTLETAFDRAVIQIQQLYEIVARGFVTQPWSEGFVVSDFMATVLDDDTAAIARASLGAVGLTGDETIAGIKTFSSQTIHSMGLGITGYLESPTKNQIWDALSPLIPNIGDKIRVSGSAAELSTIITTINGCIFRTFHMAEREAVGNIHLYHVTYQVAYDSVTAHWQSGNNQVTRGTIDIVDGSSATLGDTSFLCW